MKIPGVIAFQTLRLNKLRKIKFLYFLCFVFLSFFSDGKAESVKFLIAEENSPATLYLFPGRISLLNLPCPVTKALVGSPKDIKAEIDKLNPRDAHILLKKWRSKPSNLILKCNSKVFLFNLIPAKKSHYDYVKVLSHKETFKPFKVKSALPQSPSPKFGGLREEDFSIRKILDFSWEDSK